MDARIKIVTVKDITTLDPRTLAPSQTKQVEFTVGEHGPFFATFAMSEFNAANVERETHAVLNTLVATGAVK